MSQSSVSPEWMVLRVEQYNKISIHRQIKNYILMKGLQSCETESGSV